MLSRPALPLALLAISLLPIPAAASDAPPVAPKDPRFGIAEGFRNPGQMHAIGAGWERVVLSWPQIQPDSPDDFSWLGRTLPPESVAEELTDGVRLAGVLQFTPDWAQAQPELGERSPPLNLDLPFDDPDNYWGQFVYQTVSYYAGSIDEWIVWNEPEFRPDDPGASDSYTWLGTDEQFAQLLRVAYLAAKAANPAAVVSFPGTSYWVEALANRPPFYARVLDVLATDPDAAVWSDFHDAVSLNLYRTPDDLVRVYALFKQIQQQHGLDLPIWLLELNAMPNDDEWIPCADQFFDTPIPTTMDEQAAYAVQALALAAATGYQRIGFYRMMDGDPCSQPAVWGLTRDDGTPRPVATALATAVHELSGFIDAQFVPRVRPTQNWPAWPMDPSAAVPNWQVYQVVFTLPRRRRVTVLWNGDGRPLQVSIRRAAPLAVQVDRDGLRQPLTPTADRWVVDLPAATAHYALDPAGYYFIGGEPRIVVEDNADTALPVEPPVVVPAS